MLKFLILPLLFFTSLNAQQHHSFAATKFDLAADLPFEEPVQIAAQSDSKPQAEQKPQKKHHKVQPVEAVPTSAGSIGSVGGQEATSQQPLPQTLVPFRTLAPIAPGLVSVTPPTLAPFTPFTLATIQPLIAPQPQPQPTQVGTPSQGPQFGQGGFAPQFGQQPTGFPAPFPAQQIPPTQFQGQGFQSQGQGQFVPSQGQGFGQSQGQFIPNQGQFVPNQGQQFQSQGQQIGQGENQIPQQQRVIHEAKITERVDLWFRENYDTRICKRDSRFMANEFRLKFPSNLWRDGKESLLADLLAARLNDCFTKQESNHWRRVDELISGLNLASTEEEECRTGLIQEQISCDNVFSFTCQFIQKAYNFRLVPTRLIIQEARIAEDGAEKCRKVVRKIKKDLQG